MREAIIGLVVGVVSGLIISFFTDSSAIVIIGAGLSAVVIGSIMRKR